MTQEFRYMMHLLGAGACGFAPPMPEDELDWKRLAALAREQSVEPLIACALQSGPDIPCPREIREPMIARMYRSGVMYHRRHRLVMELLGRMEAAGITVLLLKGYSVGRYYASPECRISGDTDIYVCPEDEERARAFLREEGFEVGERWVNSHHAVCEHPVIGHVELHVKLFDEIVEDSWFQKMDGREYMQESYKKMDTRDGAYYTLGDTDNLIFLTLHLVKHFIRSGLSGRMIMDVAHFFAENRESIDYVRFWRTMEELRYKQLVACVLWAAIGYGSFAPEDFPGLPEERTELTEAVLDDLETGGWLGLKELKHREYGWFEYNRRRLMKDMSGAQYKWYMLRWRVKDGPRRLIPRLRKVIEDTPGAKGRWWRYPGVLLRWLVEFVRHRLFRQIVSDNSRFGESAEKRLDMFQDLDMI